MRQSAGGDHEDQWDAHPTDLMTNGGDGVRFRLRIATPRILTVCSRCRALATFAPKFVCNVELMMWPHRYAP